MPRGGEEGEPLPRTPPGVSWSDRLAHLTAHTSVPPMSSLLAPIALGGHSQASTPPSTATNTEAATFCGFVMRCAIAVPRWNCSETKTLQPTLLADRSMPTKVVAAVRAMPTRPRIQCSTATALSLGRRGPHLPFLAKPRSPVSMPLQ